MTPQEIARAIYDAFIEGWGSYATPAVAYNTAEEAWDESEAKKFCKRLIDRANAAHGEKHAD